MRCRTSIICFLVFFLTFILVIRKDSLCLYRALLRHLKPPWFPQCVILMFIELQFIFTSMNRVAPVKYWSIYTRNVTWWIRSVTILLVFLWTMKYLNRNLAIYILTYSYRVNEETGMLWIFWITSRTFQTVIDDRV